MGYFKDNKTATGDYLRILKRDISGKDVSIKFVSFLRLMDAAFYSVDTRSNLAKPCQVDSTLRTYVLYTLYSKKMVSPRDGNAIAINSIN